MALPTIDPDGEKQTNEVRMAQLHAEVREWGWIYDPVELMVAEFSDALFEREYEDEERLDDVEYLAANEDYDR